MDAASRMRTTASSFSSGGTGSGVSSSYSSRKGSVGQGTERAPPIGPPNRRSRGSMGYGGVAPISELDNLLLTSVSGGSDLLDLPEEGVEGGGLSPAKAAATAAARPVAGGRSRGGSRTQTNTATTTTTNSFSTAATSNTNAAPLFDVIPQEYLFNPLGAEPMLHYLPKSPPDATLRNLLAAAAEDLRLHQARQKAGLTQSREWLMEYRLDKDPDYLQRQDRLRERQDLMNKLRKEAATILQELQDKTKQAQQQGLTAQERLSLQLARWQRALELYVYCGDISTEASSLSDARELNLWILLETLIQGVAEDEHETLSDVLSQASQMCAALMDVTLVGVNDASANCREAEDSYQIRLEAHAYFGKSALKDTEEIQQSFRINGRAALQIGTQLEFAETKRRQCELAAILIRRWWMMENLAEQEAVTGEAMKVDEEVRGVIPLASCRMDPLFTRPESSLEAAKALKQLRAVVRSRGSSSGGVAASATTPSGGVNTPGSLLSGASPGGELHHHTARRFDLTANLITRTSIALEQRLLNSFSEIYAHGGTYDFGDNPRSGSIDWREMRELAKALLLFDSGRNLHKRYVEMVITSRFPELFQAKQRKPQEEEEDSEFDMDATRTQLSSLFHRVSEVCTAEFELIAHVFGRSDEDDELDVMASLPNAEDMPLTVARALLQRVISDPKNGLQARINDLLASIDRRGDFDAGAKKLDTFVVIHEKAAGLFGLLRDAADRMIDRGDNSDASTSTNHAQKETAAAAVESLKQFLTSQEIALNASHRQGYFNLELRLLHHDCCLALDQTGCPLCKPPQRRIDTTLAEKGILEEYRAPVLPLDKDHLKKAGFNEILSGPLKQSVLRQPLIHATDSLARARLMFGGGRKGGETTARVITSIYRQMCSFYGEGFLYPVVESLGEMLRTQPPPQPPQLPFDEEQPAHDLGVDPAFWVGLERVHSAAKSFDRELWAEGRPGSARVWEIMVQTGATAAMPAARECRTQFFTELERRGEAAILRVLDTISAHIQWILIIGGESMMATGGTRILHHITGQSGVSLKLGMCI